MQAGQARAHSASIILGLSNRPHWQQSLGRLYLNNLQTCRGHVNGTGALRSTVMEWLRLLAAECYSWLYKEGEGEHQHVLPTLAHPEKAFSKFHIYYYYYYYYYASNSEIKQAMTL